MSPPGKDCAAGKMEVVESWERTSEVYLCQAVTQRLQPSK